MATGPPEGIFSNESNNLVSFQCIFILKNGEGNSKCCTNSILYSFQKKGGIIWNVNKRCTLSSLESSFPQYYCFSSRKIHSHNTTVVHRRCKYKGKSRALSQLTFLIMWCNCTQIIIFRGHGTTWVYIFGQNRWFGQFLIYFHSEKWGG